MNWRLAWSFLAVWVLLDWWFGLATGWRSVVGSFVLAYDWWAFWKRAKTARRTFRLYSDRCPECGAGDHEIRTSTTIDDHGQCHVWRHCWGCGGDWEQPPR